MYYVPPMTKLFIKKRDFLKWEKHIIFVNVFSAKRRELSKKLHTGLFEGLTSSRIPSGVVC